MSKESKKFEKDVWRFVKALDAKAEVLFDRRIPDKDTGRLRQVDAWVNASLGNHIPISILVSCKKHKRKLDVTHVEAFAGEVAATRASTGVIYSASGFTRGALEKANSKGLACCQLLRDASVNIPDKLVFWSYCCTPRVSIDLVEPEPKVLRHKGIKYWKDLLGMQVTPDQTALESIADAYHKYETLAIPTRSPQNMFPQSWSVEHVFWEENDPSLICRVRVCGTWKIYRGLREAHLVKGSYCFTSDSFAGNVASPPIDLRGATPGPWWKEVTGSLNDWPAPRMVAILSSSDVKGAIHDYFWEKKIV